ncbi:prepilin-type N-terminal cleavage/methylation domain-containing protein [Bacillus dakarensis]|uniref:prepilin-type N-terminal cleavage/methylation domain-containing protein n=1 Tax=Robertmurraya dakarensis TaxID=1926278 RepID=UPI0009822E33|nr:prepilin-type N-terminal cleavage/methylation domain-containing protein [Bacillus dakarensis]
MKNERGITLIELLAAVVIIGIVIVPILMLMTGTFTRTISQGKESEIVYFAQEVMEEARASSYPKTGITEIYGTCSSNYGCDPIDLSKKDPASVNLADKQALYRIKFEALDPSITDTKFRNNFYEIKVIVETTDKPSQFTELSSVVKKQ